MGPYFSDTTIFMTFNFFLLLVSSEGAATTNSITTEESSMSPSARNLSREISDESEARLVHIHVRYVDDLYLLLILTTYTHYPFADSAGDLGCMGLYAVNDKHTLDN